MPLARNLFQLGGMARLFGPPSRRSTKAERPLSPHVERILAGRLAPQEAADALLELAAEAIKAKDPDAMQRHAEMARRLAIPEAVERLLDAARDRAVGVSTLAVALRFRGPDVVQPLLARLNTAPDLGARRAYASVAEALSRFPELRVALVAQLGRDLASRQWYVVRNALALLADLGAHVPEPLRHDLATSAHRQVRLALAQALARRPDDPSALDTLVFLLGDGDAGVRFAAVVALGASPASRARVALARHVSRELDAETRKACESALARKSSERLIA